MKKKAYFGEVIWIIGASSGIGAALAKELALRGAKLALSARRHEALEKLTRNLGDKHKFFCLDVTDPNLMLETAQEIVNTFGHIDRILFFAASYTPMKLSQLDIDLTRDIIEVNLLGALNTIHAAMPILNQQSSGQLALCSSVASYIGLPGGQPYSATKAAVTNLAESLRTECLEHIDIKLINPGFVRTALTDKNKFQMPLIMNVDTAAIKIADGLLTSKFEVSFPKRLTFVLKLLQILPYTLSLRIMRKLQNYPV